MIDLDTLNIWEGQAHADIGYSKNHISSQETRSTQTCNRLIAVISELRKCREIIGRKDKALDSFIFDGEIPSIGHSYWLDEFDLKEAREARALKIED